MKKPTKALKLVKGPGNTFDINNDKYIKDGKVLAHLGFQSDFLHVKFTTGCHISTLIFELFFLWRRVSINIPYKYIKDGKILTHMGLMSKALPGPLTD